jgi:hypothetical protein
MATIPGSHFTVSAGLAVNVVTTTTGTGLPLINPSDFNLEVFVGALANAPALAPGYSGLAVLSPTGTELDLVSGLYAATDNGILGTDTLSAYGSLETITGSASGTTLHLFGTFDVANGGGGPDTITAGSFDTVNAGSGNDGITAIGAFDVINAGTGSDTINVTGTFDTVTSGLDAGAGQNSLITLSGAFNTIVDGANQYSDTVVGFDASAGDTIKLAAGHTVATSQVIGSDTLITLSDNSTILLKGVTDIHGIFS